MAQAVELLIHLKKRHGFVSLCCFHINYIMAQEKFLYNIINFRFWPFSIKNQLKDQKTLYVSLVRHHLINTCLSNRARILGKNTNSPRVTFSAAVKMQKKSPKIISTKFWWNFFIKTRDRVFLPDPIFWRFRKFKKSSFDGNFFLFRPNWSDWFLNKSFDWRISFFGLSLALERFLAIPCTLRMNRSK